MFMFVMRVVGDRSYIVVMPL